MSWLISQAMVNSYSNSHSSQAQGAESLAGSCSGGELFAPSKSTDTPPAYLLPGKTMGAWSLSRYGTISAPSEATTQTAAECLRCFARSGIDSWSAVDSPVPISAQPEMVVVSTENFQACGASRRESFARYDHDSRSWKTRQHSLDGGSIAFSGTWPKWGSMHNGECSVGQQPDFPISEIARGLLPTPSGVNGGRNHTMGRVDEWGGSSNPLRGTVIGSMCLPEFEEMLMGWPVMWTGLMPYEMARFQEWQQQHGEY